MSKRLAGLIFITACGSAAPVATTSNTSTTHGAQPAAPARVRELDAELEQALATFRAGYGQPWAPNGPQDRAMGVASMVFAALPLIGATEQEVKTWLGPPNGIELDRWDYTRGNGEIAAIYVVRFKDGVVDGVDHFPSQ